MKNNQLSIFDTRLIEFDKFNHLKIKYNMAYPDLIVSRNGKYHIKNRKEIRYGKDGDRVYFLVSKGDLQRKYYLDFILDFVKYKNSEKCVCPCD